MSTYQRRPFSAATSKLAYAQAFTKPALNTRVMPTRGHSRHFLLASLRRFAHH